MSKLIPEQRTDKNGKLVTRHVKAMKNASIPASMPSPARPRGRSSNADIAETLTAIKEKIDNIGDYGMDILKDYAYSSPDDFREFADHLLSGGDYSDKIWDKVLMLWSPKHETLTDWADTVSFIVEINPDAENNERGWGPPTLKATTLFLFARDVARESGAKYTLREQKAIMFCHWARKYAKFDPATCWDDIAYIAKNLDEVMARREAIRERGDTSPGFIEELFKSPTAITEGTL